MSSSGLTEFKRTYELSPIILTGGIAANFPGGMIPIISLTQAQDFSSGLTGDADTSLNDFFANFIPMPGATLIDQSVGTYPFANQAVAANAVIANPLTISFRMICPARDPGGYAAKLSTMTALRTSLANHNNSGGTYTLATPSYYFVNCLMLGMRDLGTGESNQAQIEWQLDFMQPRLTLDDAQQAQNSQMSKISSGTQINGDLAWSGTQPTVGQPPSLAGSSLVPAQSSTGGSSVAGSNPFSLFSP